MPIGTARAKCCRFSAAQAGYSCSLALLIVLVAGRGLQTAVADGDTRTISMHHVHTDESITITYKRDGRYDEAALAKLNWFLRDWRRGQSTRMDPHLIDLLWEVQRETGSMQPVDVVCGYRSPQTNAMLRRQSRGVARFSQHMLGHAIDFYIPGVPLEQIREIGLRLERGGVGFYPTSGSPFVHMDTGGVRMWPRMTHNQLLHVFPDGRTVYLPADGHPLQGYAAGDGRPAQARPEPDRDLDGRGARRGPGRGYRTGNRHQPRTRTGTSCSSAPFGAGTRGAGRARPCIVAYGALGARLRAGNCGADEFAVCRAAT